MNPIDEDWLIGKLNDVARRRGPISTVLVIGDEVSRDLLGRALHDTPYRVLEAADGPVGLRLARTAMPEVILPDLIMPGVTAFDVIGELKLAPRTRNIPVVIHSRRRWATCARVPLDDCRTGSGESGGGPRDILHTFFMASFGHVAVGLLTGRLHGGVSRAPERRCSGLASWKTLLAFAALAALPDLDVLLVALGAADGGSIGHRGASHSLSMAVLTGALAALAARRFGWPALRTAVAAAAAVASHTFLDLLGAEGKGLALLWPLSAHRFHSPWRVFPDAPRGMRLLSRYGLAEVATEFGLFMPVTMYALWPRITARLRRAPPRLRVIPGAAEPGATDTAAAATDEHETPVRSTG